MPFAGANNRRGNAWLVQNPSQRDLRVIDPAFVCNLRHAIDDREVFRPVILAPRKLIGLCAHRFAIVLLATVTNHEPTCERAERRDGNSFGAA